MKYSWNRGPDNNYLIIDNSWPGSPRAIVHDMDFAQLIVDKLNGELSEELEKLEERIDDLEHDLDQATDENTGLQSKLADIVELPDMH